MWPGTCLWGPEQAFCDFFTEVCGDSAGGGLALAVCMAQPASVRRHLRGVIGPGRT